MVLAIPLAPVLIIQYDSEGNFIREWYGANEAAKKLGICQSNIWRILNGDRKTIKGFTFKYKN